MSVINTADIMEVWFAADRFDWVPFLADLIFWSGLCFAAVSPREQVRFRWNCDPPFGSSQSRQMAKLSWFRKVERGPHRVAVLASDREPKAVVELQHRRGEAPTQHRMYRIPSHDRGTMDAQECLPIELFFHFSEKCLYEMSMAFLVHSHKVAFRLHPPYIG
jgi:hypothetical protein